MGYGLTRRAILRACAAASGMLPMLEVTTPRAWAGGGGIPKRFVFFYGGVSTGTDGEGDEVVPDTVGAAYDLKRGLMPLGAAALPYGGNGQDVQDECSIVSGLLVPHNEGNALPPGGRSPEFHYNTVGPQISGVNGGADKNSGSNGPSADQIAADHLAGDTPHRSLVYRVQPVNYVGNGGGEGNSGRISWRQTDDGLVPVDPVASPQLAWSSLFSTFEPTDPAQQESFARELGRRRNVLDMLRVSTSGLLPKLGAADRMRMERHFDEIRALEMRVDEDFAAPQACMPPVDPGADPTIGAGFGETPEGTEEYSQSAGYSNEDLRARLMCDFIQMAFACDQSRVAAVRLSMDQSRVNLFPITGAEDNFHASSHGGVNATEHADAVGWHVKQFGRMVKRLRDTPEIDGSAMLDHTAVVMLFEGGIGFDPATGGQNKAHSTENMVALVAGRVGGLAPGRHIVTNGAHPAAVLLTALQATGVPVDAVGEIEATVPALFG